VAGAAAPGAAAAVTRAAVTRAGAPTGPGPMETAGERSRPPGLAGSERRGMETR